MSLHYFPSDLIFNPVENIFQNSKNEIQKQKRGKNLRIIQKINTFLYDSGGVNSARTMFEKHP